MGEFALFVEWLGPRKMQQRVFALLRERDESLRSMATFCADYQKAVG